MRTVLTMTIIAAGLFIAPTFAGAQERLGDGAMGAVAGAIVGGPVGAVAGGVVGYTAGPAIARGMGLKHRRYHRHYASQDRRR
ncbi:MAG TPA: hypothetical protein VKE53_11650 [Pseudolabrys sp.]|jgi:hypothetical protein|nr:hypothetical protein [Pseudolabrys sp.]